MKRGINLGCGKITLPCEQPSGHRLIPEGLYTSPYIEWDNVDWNAGQGINRVVDLFDYPWRDADGVPLESGVYDYAIAAHIVEHVPHHIVEHGQFVARHSEYQDGFFYFMSELNRILKPGGVAHILCPFAWSSGGFSDPTHTRYITPATFNYLIKNAESSFEYRTNGHWEEIDYGRDLVFTPHQFGVKRAIGSMRWLDHMQQSVTMGMLSIEDEWYNDQPDSKEGQDLLRGMLWLMAQMSLNAIADIMVTMRKVKPDGNQDHG